MHGDLLDLNLKRAYGGRDFMLSLRQSSLPGSENFVIVASDDAVKIL